MGKDGKRWPYNVFVARTGVKGGNKSLEYEDGGEEDSKDARKESNDGNANESLQFALPPPMALNITRAIIFDAN
jgi:hypothetical protein